MSIRLLWRYRREFWEELRDHPMRDTLVRGVLSILAVFTAGVVVGWTGRWLW